MYNMATTVIDRLTEFAPYIGGAVVLGVGVVVIRQMRKTLASKRGIHPIDMVVLHQFDRAHFAPNLSHFAVKVETYLRITKIPYVNSFSGLNGAPKGKVPWIEYNEETIPDSSFIIEFLNHKFSIDLNKDLTAEQRAAARALQKMVEENTYWCHILLRWAFHVEEMMRSYLSAPSWFINRYILWRYRRYMMNKGWVQGIGRHTYDEITHIAKGDLKALSDFLGAKNFFFGDDATEVDCAIFGQLSQIKWHTPDCEAKTYFFDECSNLDEYCDRMKAKYWPDWEECTTRGGTTKATK
ncbi:hypothetical protein CHS0354_033404 [Potamilus streckersoni]|uniref:Failed axon connections n=1 Tax=Potamilus streckersoni TaxID=2493646 RepID=A0AAE0SRE6_9BIVA|nr:hypothetical protein CHS0354_033404 [Potamilus streckersoni]